MKQGKSGDTWWVHRGDRGLAVGDGQTLMMLKGDVLVLGTF